MRSIRKAEMLAVTLAILAALVGCGGPGITAPSAQSAPAAPSALTTPAPRLAPSTANRPVTDPSAAAADAAQETCDLFAQMIDGIDTLSTREQQQLVFKMADAVQHSDNPDLMQAVVDFGQGWLNSNQDQFAKGMRVLSAICNVPYE